ncbi:hypothetical protein E2P81_ATG03266 [Venturia nashicola]|nr:hypothetical protein E2P81_ATG03266 [Venturia nashicola]
MLATHRKSSQSHGWIFAEAAPQPRDETARHGRRASKSLRQGFTEGSPRTKRAKYTGRAVPLAKEIHPHCPESRFFHCLILPCAIKPEPKKIFMSKKPTGACASTFDGRPD